MRITHRTTGIVMGIAISVLLASVISVLSGTLDSPGAPSATNSYTLEDIYNRLNDGTAGSTITFTVPLSGPTVSTMHTLDNIMSIAPTVDDANGAAVGDVLAGKTFWGRTSSGWGPRTGTLTTQTLSSANDTVTAGNYAETTLHTVDSDLAAGNIKNGVSIFGVAGTGLISSGTAAAGDVLASKTFSNDSGIGITGTIATNTLSSANDTVAAGYYAATTLHAVDSDLTALNIKKDVNIFGVVGTALTSSGSAVAGDVLASKTFSNDSGIGITGTIATKTLYPTSDTVAAGYYAATTLYAVDSDLAVPNIKFDVSIFGFVGNLAGGVACTTCATFKSGDDGQRWCNNNNGTVTDTTTGLIWLQTGGWGGKKAWRAESGNDDADTKVGLLSASDVTAGLSDGSLPGDWRLPTKSELVTRTTGLYAVTSIAFH